MYIYIYMYIIYIYITCRVYVSVGLAITAHIKATYPLINWHISMERSTIFTGKTQGISMAMLSIAMQQSLPKGKFPWIKMNKKAM